MFSGVVGRLEITSLFEPVFSSFFGLQTSFCAMLLLVPPFIGCLEAFDGLFREFDFTERIFSSYVVIFVTRGVFKLVNLFAIY